MRLSPELSNNLVLSLTGVTGGAVLDLITLWIVWLEDELAGEGVVVRVNRWRDRPEVWAGGRFLCKCQDLLQDNPD